MTVPVIDGLIIDAIRSLPSALLMNRQEEAFNTLVSKRAIKKQHIDFFTDVTSLLTMTSEVAEVPEGLLASIYR